MKQRGIGKFTRLGIAINLSLMIVSGLGVLVLVNLFAADPRLWFRLDLTQHKIHRLAEQTQQILQKVPEDVKVYTFLRPPRSAMGPLYEELDYLLDHLLKQYEYASGSRIKHRNYRIDKDYGQAKIKLQELNSREDENIVIVQYGKRTIELSLVPDIARITPPKTNPMTGQQSPPKIDSFVGEEALNSAILSVTAEQRPSIGFLSKHGEPSIHDSEKPEGLYQFAETLSKYDYAVVELDLQQPDALENISVVVSIGTRSALDDAEWQQLYQFLDQGGRMLITLDPILEASQETTFASLLWNWGLQAELGIVAEPFANQQYGIPECYQVSVLGGLSDFHPITIPLRERGIRVPFPYARALQRTAKHPQGITLVPLASTGLKAWNDMPGGNTYYPDQGSEEIGLKVLAYVINREAQAEEERMRAVVLGTSLLAVNQGFSYGRELLVNTISWLAQRGSLVAIPPRPAERKFFRWNESRAQLFYFVSIFGLPGLSVLAGVIVWFMRRR